jgi:hypothetical protein
LRDQLKELRELAFGVAETDEVHRATGTDGEPARVTPIRAARKRR